MVRVYKNAISMLETKKKKKKKTKETSGNRSLGLKICLGLWINYANDYSWKVDCLIERYFN